MKVKELIKALEDFDENMEVIIAEYQSYGSDWAYRIANVDEGIYEDFDDPYGKDEDDEPNCVELVLGRQIGTIEDNGHY